MHGNGFFLTKRLMLNKIYSCGAFLLLKISKIVIHRNGWGFFFLRLKKSESTAKQTTWVDYF